MGSGSLLATGAVVVVYRGSTAEKVRQRQLLRKVRRPWRYPNQRDTRPKSRRNERPCSCAHRLRRYVHISTTERCASSLGARG
jgi:hypothetical protein